jgi:hypothetical protein
LHIKYSRIDDRRVASRAGLKENSVTVPKKKKSKRHKPTRRTQRNDLPPPGEIGEDFPVSVPGSQNAPATTQSNWTPPPRKLTLEEQNQRAADFLREKRERRARAKEEQAGRYAEGVKTHVERQSDTTPRKKPKLCLMCDTPALDGEDYCEVHAK